MKSEISAKLKLCKQQLDALGPSRETRDLQYKFLLDLATEFQTVTSLALKAHYGGNDLFDASPTLKLATAIVSRNATFSDDVWQRGHAMAFHKVKETDNSFQPANNLFQPANNLVQPANNSFQPATSMSTFSSPSPFSTKSAFTFGNTAPRPRPLLR